jgi:hypothetical protein
MDDQFWVHGIGPCDPYIYKAHVCSIGCPVFSVHVPDIIIAVFQALRVTYMDISMVGKIITIAVPDPYPISDKTAGIGFNTVIWTTVTQLKSLATIGKETVADAV